MESLSELTSRVYREVMIRSKERVAAHDSYEQSVDHSTACRNRLHGVDRLPPIPTPVDWTPYDPSHEPAYEEAMAAERAAAATYDRAADRCTEALEDHQRLIRLISVADPKVEAEIRARWPES